MWAYDALVSTWPVDTGVMVENGIAYVAAGFMDWDGTHVYALNAQTGQLIWHNSTSGFCDKYNTSRLLHKGMTPSGTMTIASSNVWMASGNVGSPASYNVVTGGFSPPNVELGTAARGSELGLFQDNILVFGGVPLHRNGNERPWLRSEFCAFLETAANGQRLYPEVAPFGDEKLSLLLPAWDDAATMICKDNGGGLECWNTRTLAACVLTTRLANATWNPPYYVPKRVAMGIIASSGATIPNMPDPKIWGPYARDTWACVLTTNAAVVAAGNAANYNTISMSWTLSAFDRANGAVIWSMPLPAEPLINGIAIDRYGRAIVAMVDGGVMSVGIVPEPSVLLLIGCILFAARMIHRAR